jgi:hypothetical protein
MKEKKWKNKKYIYCTKGNVAHVQRYPRYLWCNINIYIYIFTPTINILN